MNKILKKVKLNAPASTSTGVDPTKGTPENPYTIEEYYAMLDNATWIGGWVEGIGYQEAMGFVLPTVVISSIMYSHEGIYLDGKYSELSLYTRQKLLNINGYVGCIFITSAYRTPEEQAQAMLANIKRTGVAKQKKIYGSYGDQVIDVYNRNRNDSENLSAMIAKIYELGPFNVSHHCGDFSQINVFDVSEGKLSNRSLFINEVEKFASKIHVENNCVHVEVMQP